jgi:tubulin polyglutamylase TTLL1/tubulin monoglycylase TTLL3/8
MRPLTPVAEPRRIEPRRRRLEAEEPRRRTASTRKEERISVKDAMRDKEWLQKAREGIVAGLSAQLLQSNGVALDCSPAPQQGFKYFVGRGNNAQLVRSVLGTRWWWGRVDEEDKHEANLVWTQWLDMAVLEQSLPLKSPVAPAVLQAVPYQLSTAVRYNPASGPYRQLPFGKLVDLTPLNYGLILQSSSFAKQKITLNFKPVDLTTCNKLECNHHLSNKKSLFLNMRIYYDALGKNPYEHIPLTFHIKEGEFEEEFKQFEANFKELAGSGCRNIWILKPGENTNRGTGISLCGSVAEVREEMRTLAAASEGQLRTFILQKYIENPLLINKRKFDIRLYTLVTAVNGVIQAYFYSEGYLRTSSKEFSLKDISNKLIHLTNDAVQKYSEDYGKYEQGNKLSYSDFQRYLDLIHREAHINFQSEILPKLREIVRDTVQAVYLKLDPRRRMHTFEVFGYDFMLDEDLRPWLIEVNTNPCLEVSSPLLARLIPNMLDNALK